MKNLLQRMALVVALITTFNASAQGVVTDNNVVLNPKGAPEVGLFFLNYIQFDGGDYTSRNIAGFDTTTVWYKALDNKQASVNTNTVLLGVNSNGDVRRFDMSALPKPTLTYTNGVLSAGNNSVTIMSANTTAYTNTVAVAGGAGNASFYLTTDKTSSGAALYPNGNIFPTPIVNDASTNYTYGWTYNSTTKLLTINVKSSPGLIVGALTLLGLPVNVANGTVVRLTCNGN